MEKLTLIMGTLQELDEEDYSELDELLTKCSICANWTPQLGVESLAGHYEEHAKMALFCDKHLGRTSSSKYFPWDKGNYSESMLRKSWKDYLHRDYKKVKTMVREYVASKKSASGDTSESCEESNEEMSHSETEEEDEVSDEITHFSRNVLPSKEEQRERQLRRADIVCTKGDKWCGQFDTQSQANTHWKLYHDPKTSGTQTSCAKCQRRFYLTSTYKRHDCDNFDITAYLDKLRFNDQPCFGLPSSVKRRSGESSKENMFTQGDRINRSPRQKRAKKRKLPSSTDDTDDEELADVLNKAKHIPFIIDENENGAAVAVPPRKETVSKRFTPVVLPPQQNELNDDDFSEDDFFVEVKPHPRSSKMGSFAKTGTIEKRRSQVKKKKDANKTGPRCPWCLEKTNVVDGFTKHVKECAKTCSKTWPFP